MPIRVAGNGVNQDKFSVLLDMIKNKEIVVKSCQLEDKKFKSKFNAFKRQVWNEGVNYPALRLGKRKIIKDSRDAEVKKEPMLIAEQFNVSGDEILGRQKFEEIRRAFTSKYIEDTDTK